MTEKNKVVNIEAPLVSLGGIKFHKAECKTGNIELDDEFYKSRLFYISLRW